MFAVTGEDIGWRIVEEDELPGGDIKQVGLVGSSQDPQNAAGVEIRGTSSLDIETSTFDFDFYQGSRSWYRPAFANQVDETPIRQTIGVSIAGSELDDRFTGVVIAAYDHRREIVASEVDFVLGKDWEGVLEGTGIDIEAMDTDFLDDGIRTDGPQLIGAAGNVAYIGITGFQMSLATGEVLPIDYAITWQFG